MGDSPLRINSHEWQRDHKIADTMRVGKYVSLVLYRVPVSNSHERQMQSVPSKNAGIISKKRRPAVGVNTQDQNATVQLRERDVQLRVLNCSWTTTTMLLLLQTPFSTKIEVCHYRDALVDCRLSSTCTRSQLQLAVDFDDIYVETSVGETAK